MWSDASTTAVFGTFSTSIGLMLALVVPSVLLAVAGLIGIGFALRKTKKHVTGKKF